LITSCPSCSLISFCTTSCCTASREAVSVREGSQESPEQTSPGRQHLPVCLHHKHPRLVDIHKSAVCSRLGCGYPTHTALHPPCTASSGEWNCRQRPVGNRRATNIAISSTSSFGLS
jgi:hypothetical protein